MDISIASLMEGVRTVAIAGHVNPDGDCAGTCQGLLTYIRTWFPETEIDLFMESTSDALAFLPGHDQIRTEITGCEEKTYDLFITCDVSSPDRLAVAEALFKKAKRTVCIDHHISNTGLADINYIRGEIGSCAEVLYGLLDPEKITLEVATCLYTGMVHDTGVFQYTNTSPRTMQIAGELMAKGVDFSTIIEKSFYQKTHLQNRIMGKVVSESRLLMNGTVVLGVIRKKELDAYGASGKDLDGIVSQLRLTRGNRAAVFIYEKAPGVFKVSMRASDEKTDVSRICVQFGGGGHKKAAGCTIEAGKVENVIRMVEEALEKELEVKA